MVIANNSFVFNNVIDHQEELEIDGGGGDINPPVSETKTVNETKGLKILWWNCRGGSILLTQPSFSFPSITFTCMSAMWFCGDISKNIPPYRMLRAKNVMHIKGGKQKLSNMKSLVKQILRAAGIANRHALVVWNWSPRKVIDLYLGVRHFFAFPCLSSYFKIFYETISQKTYYNALSKRKVKLFGEQWWNISSWWDWFGTSIIQNVNSCIYFHFSKIIDTNYVLG